MCATRNKELWPKEAEAVFLKAPTRTVHAGGDLVKVVPCPRCLLPLLHQQDAMPFVRDVLLLRNKRGKRR